MEQRIKTVLAHYHKRIEDEKVLMQSLPLEEGMKRRDEFLLSVGNETAVFMNTLIKAAQPKLILEIGTSYGYSTIWLAEAAKSYGGKVVSLENNEEKAKYALEKIREAELSDIVKVEIGDAIEYLKKTEKSFDFVLLDAWKEIYTQCFDLFYPKLTDGAWLISDNMIFPPHSKAEMDIFRKHLRETDAFDSVLMPIGSGIEVSLKRFTNVSF